MNPRVPNRFPVRHGDMVMDEHGNTDMAIKIEVRELEPLSFSQAKAMVLMLGPATNVSLGYAPAAGFHTRMADELHKLFASLPPAQAECFRRVIDHVWPRPQRHQKRPRTVHGARVTVWCNDAQKNCEILDWNDAWAAALMHASHTRETAMSTALIAARGQGDSK